MFKFSFSPWAIAHICTVLHNSAVEGLRAKRACIAFLADFHFLQDQANFRQTDLF